MPATSLIHDVVPARLPGPKPAWCLVLHGLGDSKEGWKPVAPMLGLDHVGFIFVQAPEPYYDGWSWFDIDLGKGADVAGVRRSRARLDQLIGELLTKLGVGSDRLALMGFSQGCLMVLDQAWHGSRAFAGVVGISGLVADTEGFPGTFGPAARQQRILWTHGLYDNVIPLAWTRANMLKLRTLGLTVDWREYPKDHGLDPEHELGDITAFMRTCLPR